MIFPRPFSTPSSSSRPLGPCLSLSSRLPLAEPPETKTSSRRSEFSPQQHPPAGEIWFRSRNQRHPTPDQTSCRSRSQPYQNAVCPSPCCCRHIVRVPAAYHPGSDPNTMRMQTVFVSRLRGLDLRAGSVARIVTRICGHQDKGNPKHVAACRVVVSATSSTSTPFNSAIR